MEKVAKPVVDISAQCACAKTCISVAGEILTTFLCACRECQRVTGSGHTAIALTRMTNVSTTGNLSQFDRLADSGGTVSRFFCSTCAVTLYSTTTSAPELAILPVGLFDESEWYRPNQVIFHKSHAHWDSFPQNIPTYTKYKRN